MRVFPISPLSSKKAHGALSDLSTPMRDGHRSCGAWWVEEVSWEDPTDSCKTLRPGTQEQQHLDAATRKALIARKDIGEGVIATEEGMATLLAQ